MSHVIASFKCELNRIQGIQTRLFSPASPLSPGAFRVQGLGVLDVLVDLKLRVFCFGAIAQCPVCLWFQGFKVLGFRVLGCRVQGLGFGVWGLGCQRLRI